VSDRLLKVEMYRVVREAEHRYRPELLADAVVALGFTKALEGLKQATAKQVDALLIESMQDNIAQLEALRANADDLEKWIETASSPRREIRVLAYRQLAKQGGSQAAKALVTAFGRVETEEGVELLEAVGVMEAEPAVLDLLHRVLTGPEFDVVERLPLRDMAAWSARRIGGKRMVESLLAAVERRDGRDAAVLVYLLLSDRERALATLEHYRVRRMHYLQWQRGVEFEVLDRIARRIETGRSLARYEVPPSKLEFR
jgi:hypothetical protein